MGWQWSVYVVPMFLAPALAVLITAAVYRNRSVAGSGRLLALVLTAGWWSLWYGVTLIQTEIPAKVLLYGVMFVGVALTPVAWLLFVVDYTGGGAWLTSRRIAALLVVPACTVVVALTNEPLGFHELFWANPVPETDGALVKMGAGRGVWFWIHSAYSYTLLAVSGVYLLRLAMFTDRIHRRQASALVVAVAIPVGANLIHLGGLSPIDLDVTSPALVMSGLVFAVTIYRYRLLTIVPAARQLARSELVETTPDPVVVVSDAGDVLDLNPAAASLFDSSRADAVGSPLADIAPSLEAPLDDDATELTRSDITIETNACTRRYFDVQVAPLSTRYGIVSGRLLSLRDVSNRRRREQRLSVLNRLLRHDLRNVMTTIRGNAELVEHRVDDPDLRERMAVIERNVDTIVQRREKFDSVLRSLDVETEPIDVSALVRERLDAVDVSDDIATTVEAPADCLALGHSIFQIALDELIENALEHANGEIAVSVASQDEYVEIEMYDNGVGIPAYEIEPLENGRETPLEHTSGVGLWIVKWIVESLGGSLTFAVSDGTCATVRLPREA